MIDEEIALIEKESNEFLSKNKAEYHAYKLLNRHMENLTPDTYQDFLAFIQSSHDVFFKDHASAILFFTSYIKLMWPYFKKLEILLDAIISFADEFKRLDVTDGEILQLYSSDNVFLNYLFKKNFFSIDSIFEYSINNKYLFINFLPEIREYDPEYAAIQEKTLLDSLQGLYFDFLKNFKDLVDSDPAKHVKNRESCYNPSLLHKSIRDDDIDMFQSIIAKNGIDHNYNIPSSVYERSQPTFNDSFSLLYTATVYGSKKIVKFLLLQPDIIIDDDLINAACIVNDLELIHFFEQKKTLPIEAVFAVIVYCRNDILEYFLENKLNDYNETDPLIKEVLKDKFPDDNDHLYCRLNSFELGYVIGPSNIKVLKKCLPKIVYLFKKVELKKDKNYFKNNGTSYLFYAAFHMELFKFIYSQRDHSIPIYTIDTYIHAFLSSIDTCQNDAFMFMFEDFGKKFNLHQLLMRCVRRNVQTTIFLLDKQLKEIDDCVSHEKKSIYSRICKEINFDDFKVAIDFYNEDILVKMFKLYRFVITDDKIEEIFLLLSQKMSNKMIKKFLDRIDFNWKNSFLLDALESLNLTEIFNYVISKIQ